MVTNKYQTLEEDRRGAICILYLNRPERLNAVSIQLVTDLNHFLTEMRDDHQIRVIILRGNGRAFCAGSDLTELSSEPPPEQGMGRVQYTYYRMQQAVSDIILNMRRCPQPIIGAIHGFAVGAGFSMALACDIRIVGESVRMNAGYVRVGLSGVDMGSSYFLPRIIGFSRAAEYLYTGRFIDAATADRFGMVSKVVPDDKLNDAALELAEEILQNAPFGVRLSKEVLNISIDAPSLDSAIKMENRTQVLCLSTEDGKEGIRAMMDKRKAEYHNL
ncbi:MAG: hypothetical protein A2Z19_07175 [Deltaproteobacteria bacterium RBG_16_54_18]|nr:MAG: hypothetical protein A2Z19_07175 [Deltaproteobacteria bacterium RBG_16_54_18]